MKKQRRCFDSRRLDGIYLRMVNQSAPVCLDSSVHAPLLFLLLLSSSSSSSSVSLPLHPLLRNAACSLFSGACVDSPVRFLTQKNKQKSTADERLRRLSRSDVVRICAGITALTASASSPCRNDSWGAWSTKGCKTVLTDASHTKCSCDRVSTFAILAQQPREIVSWILICYSG